MIYLHKSVFQSHGYLSSANCHVDSRWVLKVSGFALHAFRNTDSSAQVGSFSLVLLLLTYIYLFLLPPVLFFIEFQQVNLELRE